MESDETWPRPSIHYLRGFSTPKRDDTPNEDRWLVSNDGLVGAVSDGASVSYEPAAWAEILVDRFIKDQAIGPEWIDAAVSNYRSGRDRDAMEWMAQAAFDRGSFATLLGIVIEGTRAEVSVFGDSLLVLIDGDEVVRTIPYQISEEFDQSPRLLSTSVVENRAVKELDLPIASHELDLSATYYAPTLLLMTDAIGRWLLEEPEATRVGALLEIRDREVFRAFVIGEREAGRMRKDDSTLVVFGADP